MNGVPDISISAGELKITGVVNSWTVGGLVDQAKALDLTGLTTLDCTDVSSFDSAAIAFFVFLIRAVDAGSTRLMLKGDQGGLMSLATLYGVDEFFTAEREAMTKV